MKNNYETSEEISEQLKLCADMIHETDQKMLDIRRQIESAEDLPTEDDKLMEKIRRMDIKIL